MPSYDNPEDFWRNTKAEGDCLIWQGPLVPVTGYGYVFRNGKVNRAHRVAWELANGRPPPPRKYGPGGLVILHACDRPACVNPAHLSLGTQAENQKQATQRGRGKPRGRASLTATDATEIKAALARGELQATIALRFGVTPAAISHINTGKTWGHI